MSKIMLISMIITILGILSSIIGAILGILLKGKFKNNISKLYDFTAGIMTSIVIFDILYESFKIASINYIVIGFVIGCCAIYLIDSFLQNFFNGSRFFKSKIYLALAISMAVHNIIEGFAIGTGFTYSLDLGISVLIGIFLHDIPESMMISITSYKKNIKNIISTIIIGATVGVGFFIGNYMGNISNNYSAFCLSICAGCMLYMVSCNIMPESKKNSKNNNVSFMYIIGIIIGSLITKI